MPLWLETLKIGMVSPSDSFLSRFFSFSDISDICRTLLAKQIVRAIIPLRNVCHYHHHLFLKFKYFTTMISFDTIWQQQVPITLQSPKTDTFLVVKPWLTPGFILVSTNSHSPFQGGRGALNSIIMNETEFANTYLQYESSAR